MPVTWGIGFAVFRVDRGYRGAVAEFGRYDARRRGFLRDSAFLAVAAVAPSRDWLLATLDATDRAGRAGVVTHQVGGICETFAAFQKAEAVHGGGHAREALAEYVTSRVLPLLHDADPDTEAGAALFAAASEQTDLLGWMAIDDGRQALGQRYLIQALRLAQEAGDAAFGGQVLADLSQQARMLGHPGEALRLAKTGRHGLAGVHNPACAARLLALEGRAYAALGDRPAAVHAVIKSEQQFERIKADEGPEWARFIDAAALNSVWSDTFVDLRRPAEAARFARQSIAATEGQNRAPCASRTNAILACAALLRRDVDGALGAARRAVDLAVTVRSSRCLDAVRDLRSRFGPYRALSAVRDFDDHTRDALTRASLN